MADRPSLDECLEGVPSGKLGRPCKDVHLCEISLSVTNWRAIAPFLGLSKVVEEQIERDEGKTDTQKIAMLRRWREKFGRKATYRRLATVFWKLERADLIDAICDVLVDSSSSSDEECSASEEPVYRDILQHYIHHLRCKYVNEIPNTTQWPPSPTRKVFNLAMIHRMPVQRVPVSDDYIRQTQMGKVDDIMLKKFSIDLKHIFDSQPRDYSRRNLILIEGAPGAGKSTLAWHICQRWGSGSLCGKFNLVVFVQLRDPAIGSATSIADILPGMANGQQREVLSKLEARNGKGVLFVLDGWDEYAKGLSRDSICGKLICCPGDLSMQESTLLITSRPVASGNLQNHCSIRIEIIGFTPAEVREYFREALREAHQEVQHVALQECLEVRPVIQASCYLPLNAAIVVHLFITEGNTLPTTLHSLFTTLVLNCIVRHLKRETEGEGKRLPKLKSLDHIPIKIQPYFSSLCALAFHGIKKNKASFSEEDLHSVDISTDLSEQLLSLIQGWSTFRSSWEELSYSFFHLSIQELLAAYHIHKHCSPSEQVQIFRELFDQPRFAAVLQFYAAFTRFEVEGIREFLKEVLVGASSFGTTYKATAAILDCLYEAQDPSLCQYVAGLMENKLTVNYTASPLHCMVLGYFLCCIAPTDRYGKFHIHFNKCAIDAYKFNYLINELKNCRYGQLALSLDGENKTIAVVIMDLLEENCSNCISELIVSVCVSSLDDALDEFVSAQSCGIPRVSVDVNYKKYDGFYFDEDIDDYVYDSDSDSDEDDYNVLSVVRECDTTGRKTLKLWGKEADLLPETLPCILAEHTTMDTLELSGDVMGQYEARELFTALATNTTLRSLKLSELYNETDESFTLTGSIEALSHTLANNSALKELHLSDCGLRCRDIETLAEGLAENSALELLDLSESRAFMADLSSRDTKALASALAGNRTVKTLDLSGRKIEPRGVKALADSLAGNSSLKELILSRCELSQDDLRALADSLLTTNGLAVLVLSQNYLGDDGLWHVIQALKVNTALKSLDISNCRIGGQMLVHLVTAGKSLETLILSGNNLSYTDCGQTGAHYLAQGLRQNTSLRRLSIEQCKLTDDTLEVVIGALEQHPSMEEISFGGNELTANVLKTLSRSLKNIRHLQKVTLGFINELADQKFTSFILELEKSRIDCIYEFRSHFVMWQLGIHASPNSLMLTEQLQWC